MLPLDAETKAIPNSEAEIEKGLIEGTVKSLKDFAGGRYTVFEDDEDMEAHLMRL